MPIRNQLPNVQSLPAQTAVILKQRILGGAYPETLPGEPQLSETLQVSRGTVRKALAQLTSEGVIAPSDHGKPRKVLIQASTSKPLTRKIGIVIPKKHDELHASLQDLLRSLRKKLEGHGIECAFHPVPFQTSHQPGRLMNQLVKTQNAGLWIVLEITHKLANWFLGKSIPVLACGGECPETVPRVSYDLSATTRHALPLLFGHGHERIIHFSPHNINKLQDLTKDAFAKQGKKFDPAFHVQRHDGTREHMLHLLEKSYANPAPPTAFITSSPWQLLTLVTWLAGRGLKVGKDVSIINIGSDPVLEFITPNISHYTTKFETLSRALSRLSQRILQGEPVEQKFFVMDYVKGKSVGRV